jgi:WD40 repeat protein
MHSHSDSILSMDFHVTQNVIITCSKDGTIKLWSMHDLQNPILFISKIDQPLCVAAHPTAPIFSCGFQSGTMRVFNMEQKCQLDEFTQFNKPVKKLCYSPNGDILVTCSEDGSVALHSATRQHLPTKMMHLEFPPKFVHIAFSPATTRKCLFKNDENSLQNEDISLED